MQIFKRTSSIWNEATLAAVGKSARWRSGDGSFAHWTTVYYRAGIQRNQTWRKSGTYNLGFKRGYLGFGLQHFTLRNHGGIQDLPSQENASRTEEHAGKVSIVTMQQHPQLWFSWHPRRWRCSGLSLQQLLKSPQVSELCLELDKKRWRDLSCNLSFAFCLHVSETTLAVLGICSQDAK